MPHLIAHRRHAVARPPASAAELSAPRYVSHVPERTLLYGLVQAYYPDFPEPLERENLALPEYVREEFDEFLRCGARRMVESARHLVEEVFGPRPVRQWVLSFPYPLRLLFASKPADTASRLFRCVRRCCGARACYNANDSHLHWLLVGRVSP